MIDADLDFTRLVIQVVKKRYRLVAGWVLGAGLVGVVVAIALPPRWSATASFLPVARSAQRLPSGLSAVASQLGLALEGPGDVSPRFYGDLIRGRVILETVLNRPLPDSLFASLSLRSATLGQWLVGTDHPPSNIQMNHALRRLERAISSRADNTTRLVSFSVTLGSRRIAIWTASQLIAETNDFNRRVFRSTAKARREFLAGRVTETIAELKKAEDALATFYHRNRQWQNSPELSVQEGRLKRDVQLRQDLYTTLSQQYEVARIDEVNETPLITLVDEPWAPVQRSSPRRKLIVIGAALIGLLLGSINAMSTFGAASRRRAT